MTTKHDTPERRALSIQGVCDYFDISRASYYRLVDKGVLPRPRLIGNLRRHDFETVKAVADRVFSERGL